MEDLEAGGWYGGSGTYPDGSGDDDRGGGGGSGFVFTSNTASNVPSGYVLSSDRHLENANTIGGNSIIPSYDASGTMTGNTGDGHAKITFLYKASSELTLNGEEKVKIFKGSNYQDAGATLIQSGKDISNQIQVTGSVNTSIAGEYTITYSYETHTVSRKVTVIENKFVFSHTGDVQSFTAAETGIYKLQVWGASRRRIFIIYRWKRWVFRR